MRLHLVQLYMTSRKFQRAVTWKPLQIRPNLLLKMNRKSYGLSFGGIYFDLDS